MIESRLEVAHAAFVCQHIVVIMQGDELAQVMRFCLILMQVGAVQLSLIG
jgi:hypothetical protein